MKNEEVNANAKSVLSVLGACIKSGDEITIICEGEDEEIALSDMVQLVKDGLGEYVVFINWYIVTVKRH